MVGRRPIPPALQLRLPWDVRIDAGAQRPGSRYPLSMPAARSVPPNVGAALDLLGVDHALLGDVMPRVDPYRVRLRVAPAWFLVLWARGIAAITTPWGVYVHPSVEARFGSVPADRSLGLLMVHELMHVEQLARLGTLRHTARYLADYLRGRLNRRGHWQAYREVQLEVEARAATALVRHRMQRATPQ